VEAAFLPFIGMWVVTGSIWKFLLKQLPVLSVKQFLVGLYWIKVCDTVDFEYSDNGAATDSALPLTQR